MKKILRSAIVALSALSIGVSAVSVPTNAVYADAVATNITKGNYQKTISAAEYSGDGAKYPTLTAYMYHIRKDGFCANTTDSSGATLNDRLNSLRTPDSVNGVVWDSPLQPGDCVAVRFEYLNARKAQDFGSRNAYDIYISGTRTDFSRNNSSWQPFGVQYLGVDGWKTPNMSANDFYYGGRINAAGVALTLSATVTADNIKELSTNFINVNIPFTMDPNNDAQVIRGPYKVSPKITTFKMPNDGYYFAYELPEPDYVKTVTDALAQTSNLSDDQKTAFTKRATDIKNSSDDSTTKSKNTDALVTELKNLDTAIGKAKTAATNARQNLGADYGNTAVANANAVLVEAYSKSDATVDSVNAAVTAYQKAIDTVKAGTTLRGWVDQQTKATAAGLDGLSTAQVSALKDQTAAAAASDGATATFKTNVVNLITAIKSAGSAISAAKQDLGDNADLNAAIKTLTDAASTSTDPAAVNKAVSDFNAAVQNIKNAATSRQQAVTAANTAVKDAEAAMKDVLADASNAAKANGYKEALNSVLNNTASTPEQIQAAVKTYQDNMSALYADSVVDPAANNAALSEAQKKDIQDKRQAILNDSSKSFQDKIAALDDLKKNTDTLVSALNNVTSKAAQAGSAADSLDGLNKDQVSVWQSSIESIVNNANMTADQKKSKIQEMNNLLNKLVDAIARAKAKVAQIRADMSNASDSESAAKQAAAQKVEIQIQKLVAAASAATDPTDATDEDNQVIIIEQGEVDLDQAYLEYQNERENPADRATETPKPSGSSVSWWQILLIILGLAGIGAGVAASQGMVR
ncbi:MAG: hypothetical protein Q3962_06665 [Corynebacterium sp.]|nr:hypothetical protein [Corynebacterium sp.]